jgi:hypothetical protein
MSLLTVVVVKSIISLLLYFKILENSSLYITCLSFAFRRCENICDVISTIGVFVVHDRGVYLAWSLICAVLVHLIHVGNSNSVVLQSVVSITLDSSLTSGTW